jgi:NAD dependent epimerase/dehydratase
MTVLVTGAGGFIGSHLCERLVAVGADVRALCRYTSGRDPRNLAELEPDVFASLDVRFGDVLDGDLVRDVAAGCDTIYHLAASISVPYSYVAPREVVRTNVEGTLNVLQAARGTGATVVQMSSSEVYGTAQYVPMDEDHPLGAQSPYAASKVGADKLAETFHKSFGLPIVVARPFNTFGPRQSRRAVIGTLVTQALHANGVQLGTTSSRRDFVYVRDTADALVRLAESGRWGETFNIATGVDVSIQEVADLVADILGRELAVVSREERIRPEASEVMRLAGDASRLRQATGWEPATDLRTGLDQVIEWVAEHPLPVTAHVYEV